eukprot:CAMPEP_0172311374 /NCGR_PEP_ID=MMETSP1058-20130122/14638_1 /TAXON_ID=83371 /ORGANISM="Detonula confervacea, Strain CCMP 353" /LENGTH=69 /DNA_ID=CAMNT_0013024533 /DNA_START=1 /DNA_END=210 /DNA_ORIENTATION=-
MLASDEFRKAGQQQLSQQEDMTLRQALALRVAPSLSQGGGGGGGAQFSSSAPDAGAATTTTHAAAATPP